ncbi:hypothetical protein CRUP_006787, partial [Coryphaenoides rupestris]
TGKFFGEAEGAVMSKLLQMGSFKRFLVEFNLYSWWYSDLTVKGHKMGRTMQVPSFVIQQIPSSNLFMVVVDNKCDCSMVRGEGAESKFIPEEGLGVQSLSVQMYGGDEI